MTVTGVLDVTKASVLGAMAKGTTETTRKNPRRVVAEDDAEASEFLSSLSLLSLISSLSSTLLTHGEANKENERH
jgi:hypothetical protein